MFFGLGFWNKRLTFEVFLKTEDRWQLHMLCDTEEDAIAEARHLLITDKTHDVKVVRLRTLVNGVGSETVVYEQSRPPRTVKPLTVCTPVGEVALCQQLEDLYTAEGRRTISQVMRDYLQRNNIGTSELLHCYSHIRKLQDAQGLVNAALHRVAGVQAPVAGQTPKQRLTLLDGLVTQAQQKARAFAAERSSYPDFRGKDLGGFSQHILERTSLDLHDYVLNSLISIWLFDYRSLLGKVEALAILAGENVENGLIRQVDAILADLLIFADVVQELLAPQPTLGDALLRLADIVLCRKGAGESLASPAMKQIARLIQEGHLPLSQAALAERLLREINADKPLDTRDPSRDPALLERLVMALSGEDGTILGGEATRQSIERRRLRQREAVLRAHGLHSIADNLR
ncbi:hypothetical protein [Niveispirillum sp. BGYR6]|uniref:hypothetical protein n=1 Tax=Niveispirillum sp. BGYR6 TaxID=2971249 RepID=UPI0022B9CCF4|nr:hypothetical protein [Niveispirillum sp. BGYR6]MDG5493480.1 hypothetical protein [Niveispirillum sp. BGYR6]